jgi:UDP-glucose 4-epimerase
MAGHFGIEASKKCYEIIGTAAVERDGIDVVFARIGSIWGPLGNPASPFFPVAALVHAAVRDERVDLTRFHADDGADMLYAPDCGRALIALHTAPTLHHRVYNVGSGRAVSNAEMATAAAATADLSPGRGPDGTYVLDVERLTKDTGFHPEYDLHQAIGHYKRWLLDGHER